jgi:cytochrome c-type biogenesis protein
VLSRIPIAFLAGLLSIAFPCVLPLVPGYLSAVSAVEASRLGQPGTARRVALATLPFALGFTVVFVALGVAAAAVAEVLGARSQAQVAGLVLVVFGLGFMGLLPLPERIVAGGLLVRARETGSRALLGAAFAVCAAPCIGGVLAGILVLAGDAGTVVRGAVLLFFYAAGIASAFLLVALAFTRAMAAFRWVRDRTNVLQAVSGAALLALGLLLFFDRYWWLQVAFNRALDSLGLDDAL